MKKFKVKFYMEYELNAEDKEKAFDKAETLFVEDIENNHFGFTEIFNHEVKEDEKH